MNNVLLLLRNVEAVGRLKEKLREGYALFFLK
jgi:hypothetical protein